MPAVGKEIQHPLTPLETAQPVEQVNYVEKVKEQTEVQPQTGGQTQPPQAVTTNEIDDMGKVVSAQFAIQTKSNITLPMNQQEMVEGLHHKVWKSVRWASEWCMMMIKKYPGRVFYLPPEKV